jgi:hypothetical protein
VAAFEADRKKEAWCGVKESHFTARRFLFVDVDAIHPSGMVSSEAQRQGAFQKACEIELLVPI